MSLKNNIAKHLVNLISKSWRIKIQGELPKSPAIIVFWHGEMLPCWNIFRKKNPVAVVSKSKDGQILSDVLELWGFELVRGSSSSSGKEVLLEIIKNAKDRFVLMTPDGPRGPRNEFKAGAAVASLRTGTPIFFLKTEIKSKKIFERSWDKFQFPLPFSRINISVSKPYTIDANSSREEVSYFINMIQSDMNA